MSIKLKQESEELMDYPEIDQEELSTSEEPTPKYTYILPPEQEEELERMADEILAAEQKEKKPKSRYEETLKGIILGTSIGITTVMPFMLVSAVWNHIHKKSVATNIPPKEKPQLQNPSQEFQLLNDPNNCGVPNRVCNAGQYCENGYCKFIDPQGSCVPSREVCNDIDDDCDGIIDDGFNLETDNDNCGMCGRVCASGQHCTNGTCAWNPTATIDEEFNEPSK